MSKGVWRTSSILLVVVLFVAGCGEAEEPASGTEEPDDQAEEQEEEGQEEQEEEEESEAEEGEEPSDEGATAHGYADGDEIHLVLSSSPGGGFDSQGRAVAGPIESAFHDMFGIDVSVVVENMPGAGHRLGAEFVNRAAPDGKTFLFTPAQAAATNQTIEGADFDLREMTGIASAGSTSRGIAVQTGLDLPDHTLEGLVQRSSQRPVVMSAQDEGRIQLMQDLIAREGYDFQVDVVAGYSTSDTVTGLIRGDLEAGVSTIESMAPFVEDFEDVEFLIDLGCTPTEGYGVPTIVEEGFPTPEVAEQICLPVGRTDRLFFGPPGIPPETVETLDAVMEAALTSDEYREAVGDLAAPHQDHEEVDRILQSLVDTYEEWLEGQ